MIKLEVVFSAGTLKHGILEVPDEAMKLSEPKRRHLISEHIISSLNAQGNYGWKPDIWWLNGKKNISIITCKIIKNHGKKS